MARRTVRVGFAGLSFALAAALAGCGGNDDNGTAPLSECTAAVSSITISSGTTPRFTWSPGCGVRELVVRRVSDAHTMWLTDAVGATSLIASGVNYGTAPAGATASGAESLSPGTTYVVVLYRNVGSSGPVGSQQWTP